MTNARRSREKHRMEEKEIQARQDEQQRVEEMASRNEVFNCSGSQIHSPSCDGECGFRVLSALEVLINEEHVKWEELGMVPIGSLPQVPQIPGVPVDILKISVALAALTELCYDMGLDKKRLNEKFQEMYLEKIITIRLANQDAIRQARAHARIAVPGADVLPQLVVPEHIKRRMH